MKDETLLGPWVRRFLLEHLVAERNLARNTQVSYRDTLSLLLPFVGKHGGHAIDRMTVEASDAVCGPQLPRPPGTRPKMQWRHPQPKARDHPIIGAVHRHALTGACGLVRRDTERRRSRRQPRPRIGYLEKVEMDALLARPNRCTALGDRDHALLLFLYNSGARADEAATLTIDRLQLGAQSSVRLHGKGNKFRTCPLWPVTATSLSRLIANRGKGEPVFLNRSNQPLTRFGIHRLVTQYAEQASRDHALDGRRSG